MSTNLSKRTKEWMELERKTLEQRKKAEEFYETQLMSLIEMDFIKRNKDKLYERAEYFVVSVGTSYEPIVLSLKLFQPSKTLFLYTEKSEDILSKTVEYCGLTPKMYQKSKVSDTNPLDIYREIKKSYLEWGRPKKMYIDFTGGTKAMSAAAAMAGALVDVQLVYVGSNDFLADFRKPRPGSETLYYINNPLAVFGDLEIEKALALFERYNYAGAQAKLSKLKESIPDPNMRQQLNFVYLLARSYEAWDALDFITAYKEMVRLNEELRRDRMMHNTFMLMDYCEELKQQEYLLGHLQQIPQILKGKSNVSILQSKDTMVSLMFTMYQNALTREKQEKYDMATLLLYRLLEMIEQRRLIHYNLDVSKMDYVNIRYNLNGMPELEDVAQEERLPILKNKILTYKKELFARNVSTYLPEQVSLLEGFIILSALGDPIMQLRSKKPLDKLKRIRSMVFLRNNSIFAHGLGPVGYSDFSKFKLFVEEMFQDFCSIEKISFDKYSSIVEWISPLRSRYYAIGLEG